MIDKKPTTKEALMSKELEPKERWIVYDDEQYYPYAKMFFSEDRAWEAYGDIVRQGLGVGAVIARVIAFSGNIVEEDHDSLD